METDPNHDPLVLDLHAISDAEAIDFLKAAVEDVIQLVENVNQKQRNLRDVGNQHQENEKYAGPW